jgi:hypothetical protein
MVNKGAQALEKNPNWRGGRSIASNGYVLLKRPEHPAADIRGYVYEHRLVAEQMIGRPLRPGEVPHHKNHDKTDNRPENLEVTTRAGHGVLHRRKSGRRIPGQDNAPVGCECGCGESFLRFDDDKRPRRFISGHNLHPR